MKHDHSFAPGAAAGHGCRICGSNDIDGLIDEIAERIWECRRDPVLKDPPWAEASDYWKMTLREYAREMLDVVRR